MVVPPKRFGQPKKVTKQISQIPQIPQIPLPKNQGAWVYELMRSIVWVSAGLSWKVPDQFRSWYRYGRDGPREGPLLEFEILRSVLEITFGKGTTDPPSGLVIDPSSPEPKAPEYLVESSNA